MSKDSILETSSISQKSGNSAASRGRLLGPLFCFVALSFSVIGQALLTHVSPHFSFLDSVPQGSRVTLGLGLSLLAALMFGFASRQPESVWLRCNPVRDIGTSWSSKRAIGGVLISGTILLASLVLFAISNRNHIVGAANELFDSTHLWWASALLFWLGLCVTWGFERSKNSLESSPPFARWNYITVFVIVIVAGVLRFYRLEEIPLDVNMDDVSAMTYAQLALAPRSWFTPGLGQFNTPAVAFAFIRMSAWFTAPDLYGLRLPEAILGTLMVLGSYLLCWRCFDSHKLAIVCSSLLAGHAGLIHYSRHVMNLDPWTFALFAITSLTHGVRSNRIWALGLAGFLFGFSVQLYLAARAIVFAMPWFLIYLFRNRRSEFLGFYAGWIVFLLGGMVAIGPNLADMVYGSAAWGASNRVDASLLGTRYLCEKAGSEGTVLPLIYGQITAFLQAFQVHRDVSAQGQYFAPLFDLIITPFLWLGLGTAIVGWSRNPAMTLISIIAAMSVLLGQLLQPILPYWPRIVFLMFCGGLWSALGLVNTCEAAIDLVRWLTSWGPSLQRSVVKYTSCLLSLLLAGIIFQVGMRQWTGYLAAVGSQADSHSWLVRWVSKLPKNATVCGAISASTIFVGNQMVPFFAQGRAFKWLNTTPAVDAADQCGPRPFAWAIAPDQAALKEKLTILYPDGKLMEHYSHAGGFMFWSFLVP